MNKKAVFTSAIMVLAGCATVPTTKDTLTPQQRIDLITPIYCDESSCEEVWQRGVEFASISSGNNLKVNSSDLVMFETLGAVSLGMKMIKHSLGEGKFQIEVETWCDSAYNGCFQNPYELKANAKAYILNNSQR